MYYFLIYVTIGLLTMLCFVIKNRNTLDRRLFRAMYKEFKSKDCLRDVDLTTSKEGEKLLIVCKVLFLILGIFLWPIAFLKIRE